MCVIYMYEEKRAELFLNHVLFSVFLESSIFRKNDICVHLLDAFINVIQFIVNDENTEVTWRTKKTPWNTFIQESLLDLELEQEEEA